MKSKYSENQQKAIFGMLKTKGIMYQGYVNVWRAFLVTNISPETKILLLYLSTIQKQNKDEYIHEPVEKLAHDLCISKKTFYKARTEAVYKGFLDVKMTKYKVKEGLYSKKCTYRVTIEEDNSYIQAAIDRFPSVKNKNGELAYGNVPKSVLTNRDLNTHSKALYSLLATFAGDMPAKIKKVKSGTRFIAQVKPKIIQASLSMSRRTYNRALNSLIDQNFISRVSRVGLTSDYTRLELIYTPSLSAGIEARNQRRALGTKIVAQRELAVEFRKRLMSKSATVVEEVQKAVDKATKATSAFPEGWNEILQDPDAHIARINKEDNSFFEQQESAFKDSVKTAVLSGMREWAANRTHTQKPFDWIINYDPQMWDLIIQEIIDTKVPIKKDIVYDHIETCFNYKKTISNFVQFFCNGVIAQARKAIEQENDRQELPRVSTVNWLQSEPFEF